MSAVVTEAAIVTFICSDESGEPVEILHQTAEEAAAEFVDESDYDVSTSQRYYVRVRTPGEARTGERGIEIGVVRHPSEPSCATGREGHDWTPDKDGVWGSKRSGAGVHTEETCAVCGWRRIMDGGDQDHRGARLSSVAYAHPTDNDGEDFDHDLPFDGSQLEDL